MKQQHTFVISLVMVGLMALTACVQASPEEPVETNIQQSEAAAEVLDEILEEEALSASEYLAANPELKVVEQYANRVDEAATGSGFYAANPELMTAGRYGAEVIKHEETTGSTFFAANPELMAAQRFTAASNQ